MRREVVSFVRRSTRMNASQQKAWDKHHDRLVVEPTEGATSTAIAEHDRFDHEAVFGRRAPLVVEIGSGAGESLVTMAGNRPEVDVLAFEVFLPAVASTLSRINRSGIDNARVVTRDGVAALRTWLQDEPITELWTFFPDPWHKGRHHKRRLVSTEFADLVAQRLLPGGLWRIATDWADYAVHSTEVLGAHPAFELVSTDRADRPVTKYEQRGLTAGRAIVDLCWRRR